MAGRDLPSEVMGQLTLTELSYLLVTRREPTEGQRRLVDAVLVSLADHGLTPSALATRLTYTGAPESIQGAVAAGLLGAGSVFLGPTGDTAEFLAAALADAGDVTATDAETLRPIAEAAVAARRGAGLRVPGLGHPVHKSGDPRTPRLYELAEARGPARSAPEPAGGGGRGPRRGERQAICRSTVPAPAERPCSMPASPPRAVRGMALIARTAGLVAHLVEEADTPIGMPLWLEVESRANDDA